jgi:gamma-glutamylcyclotransferase (GGCT)/AIG2-like uncharacterized protein YtfP
LTGSPINLFTYGTLLIPEVMQAVTGRKFPSGDAVLNGYCRYSIKNRVYPAVIARAGASVHGRTYSELDRHTLEILDEFESDIYTRCSMPVMTAASVSVEAQVYVLSDQYRHLLLEDPWETEYFKQHFLTRYLESCRRFYLAHEGRLHT